MVDSERMYELTFATHSRTGLACQSWCSPRGKPSGWLEVHSAVDRVDALVERCHLDKWAKKPETRPWGVSLFLTFGAKVGHIDDAGAPAAAEHDAPDAAPEVVTTPVEPFHGP